MEKYDLTFLEALDIVINGGWVKGNNFKEGYFLKLNSFGQLVIVDVMRFYDEDTNVFFKQMSYQKFRKITIATKKELSY